MFYSYPWYYYPYTPPLPYDPFIMMNMMMYSMIYPYYYALMLEMYRAMIDAWRKSLEVLTKSVEVSK